MLSTGNNIDELLCLSGWKIEKYELDENSSTVYLYLSPEIGYTYECLHCRTGVLFCHDHSAPRKIRDLSLWGYSCFLVFSRGRIYCPDCEKFSDVCYTHHILFIYNGYGCILSGFLFSFPVLAGNIN